MYLWFVKFIKTWRFCTIFTIIILFFNFFMVVAPNKIFGSETTSAALHHNEHIIWSSAPKPLPSPKHKIWFRDLELIHDINTYDVILGSGTAFVAPRHNIWLRACSRFAALKHDIIQSMAPQKLPRLRMKFPHFAT